MCAMACVERGRITSDAASAGATTRRGSDRGGRIKEQSASTISAPLVHLLTSGAAGHASQRPPSRPPYSTNGKAALCQPSRDTQVAVSQAILEVEDGGGKLGPISDPEALAGIVRSAHTGSGGLQDHLKAACEKWLALNHKD
jgi:hypothetical protein